MISIHGIPEEILSQIFKHLPRPEYLKCQRVCRAWYLPAHILLLNEIKVRDESQVQKFVSSIDYNPDRKYLNAVKKILISANMPFDQDSIYKLLLRFQNLTNVEIFDCIALLEEFTDEICHEVLEKCQKLNRFEVHFSLATMDRYNHLLYRVRLLATFVNLSGYDTQQGNVIQYLTSFPRLRRILGSSEHLTNFHQLLQVLQRLPNLKDIELFVEEDQHYLVEGHFAITTRHEQDTLINRLSNITQFEITYRRGLGVSSMRFITTYFTGLEDFIMSIECFGQDWTDQQRLVFLSSLDFICKTKNTGNIFLLEFDPLLFQHYLPIVQNKVIRSPGTFRVNIHSPYDSDDTDFVDFYIQSTRSSKQLTLVLGKLHLTEIPNHLPLMNSIGTLEIVLEESNRDYNDESNTNAYEDLFGKFPMLKKVILDIPQSYQESRYTSTTFPLVEELRIQAHPNVQIQGILNRFSFTFPNLKYLDLYDFNGRWKEDGKEVYVDLLHYSLQRLTMGLTFVTNYLEKEEQKFYVVELRLVDDFQKHLYKLTSRPLSAQCTNENELQDYTDYMRVKITVDSLQRLEIYYPSKGRLCDLNLTNYTQQTYGIDLVDTIPHITLFQRD